MMKFMCIFVCAIAAVSAHPYGNQGYGRVPVGALAYQVQPALTVSAIIPAGGYGGRSYGAGYGANNHVRSIEVPVSAVHTSNSNYGPAPVDRQALALAKLSLAAPSAGAPLVWNEPLLLAERRIAPQQAYKQQSSYGLAQEAQGGSAAAASSSVAGKNNAYQNSAY